MHVLIVLGYRDPAEIVCPVVPSVSVDMVYESLAVGIRHERLRHESVHGETSLNRISKANPKISFSRIVDFSVKFARRISYIAVVRHRPSTKTVFALYLFKRFHIEIMPRVDRP